jgi:hypothetical protein
MGGAMDELAEPVSDTAEPGARAPLEPGTEVEVRNRFDRRWVHGFVVIAATPAGYRILRLSDRSELPELFGRDELRRRRGRQDFWWH